MKNNLIDQAKQIIAECPCPGKTSPSQYRDYLIPELFERNISGVKLSQLSDAILIAEIHTGLSVKRDPKKIIRHINLSINYN